MGKVKVIDKAPQFIRVNELVFDNALARMAKDIVQVAQIRVPFKDGDLHKEIRQVKLGTLRHQVRVDSEYAAYQEKGRRADGTRVVRRYTTPGTGKKYLESAGKQIVGQALNYFKQAANQARV